MTDHQPAQTRAVIYARFSSDLQNQRSIDDQIALCSSYAERQGASVVATYSDSAMSGSSIIGRTGLLDMLTAAKSGAFDVVYVEALDRLSRDQEDLAHIHKRLSFVGIAIETVHEGKADQVQVGIRAMLGSLYLADLAHKTRRGLHGVVRDGRSAGGRAYGYKTRKGEPGVLDIDPAEAKVVKRIFWEYSLGKCPRQIARDLNRDGIAPPRGGGTWNASTINGNVSRGFGILQNPLYAGRLVWNRTRMIKDPDTGKRISRINPKSEWTETLRPDLAIVDQAIWDKVQEKKARNASGWKLSDHKHRNKHALSGLMRCGECGGGMSLNGTRSGHRLLMCSKTRESSSCSSRAVRLSHVEQAVVDSLAAELDRPETVKAYLDEYRAEWERLAAKARSKRSDAEKELAEVKRSLNRIVDAVAEGLLSADDVRERKAALEERREAAERSIAMAEASVPVMRVAGDAVERMREVTKRLKADVSSAMVEDLETRAAIRELIERVVITTQPEMSVQVVLVGSAFMKADGRTVETGGCGGWIYSIPTVLIQFPSIRLPAVFSAKDQAGRRQASV